MSLYLNATNFGIQGQNIHISKTNVVGCRFVDDAPLCLNCDIGNLRKLERVSQTSHLPYEKKLDSGISLKVPILASNGFQRVH